jgi:chorismate mutase
MVSLRGATTISQDKEEELLGAAEELLRQMIHHNRLDMERIHAIFFTCTRDIVSAYPARAARALGITKASLMCLQEMYVENSLEKMHQGMYFL